MKQVKSLIAGIFLAIASFGMAALAPSVAYAQHNGISRAMADEILKYVNEYRNKKRLPDLEMNSTISEAATKHSREMANKDIPFGHQGFDERMAWIMTRIKPSNAAAENVAEGSQSARDVVDLWLHSSGHRHNIEGHYNLTGIGIARADDGTLYFTQIFINKK